jgi:hypothetical protein
MRNLATVIDMMLRLIPIEEEQLRSDLKRVQTNLIYSAPKTAGSQWSEVEEILKNRFGSDPSEKWQFIVLSAWITRTPYEIQRMFK